MRAHGRAGNRHASSQLKQSERTGRASGATERIQRKSRSIHQCRLHARTGEASAPRDERAACCCAADSLPCTRPLVRCPTTRHLRAVLAPTATHFHVHQCACVRARVADRSHTALGASALAESATGTGVRVLLVRPAVSPSWNVTLFSL